MGIGRLGVVVWLCVAFAGTVYAQVPQMVPNRPDWWRNGASLDMDFYHNRYMVSLTTPVTYTSLTQFVGAVSGTFTRPGADETATGEPFYLGANQNFVSRASAGTYFDSSGVVRTAASNVARADYDPVTHAYKGVLAEPARTNLLRALPTGWYQNVSSVTTVKHETLAPDGSTAYSIETTQGTAGYFKFFDASASTPYTWSAFVKNISGNSIVRIGNDTQKCGDNQTCYCQFDALNGTFTWASPGVTAYTAQDVGNGWHRISCTGTTITSLTSQIDALAYNVGAGENAYWGMQMEAGSSPTSYISTVDTALVTRAADVYTSAYSGTYFDASGTLRQAPANTPRLDHDPSTGEPRGVLIEERRTNLVSNTNLMAWTSSTLYPISTGSGAYGNTSYVVTDNDVATRGGVVVRMGAVLSASTVYTSSIYVKVDPLMNDDEPLFRIGHFYGGNGDYYTGCTFNPATGATSNYGATTCRSNRYGDYWRLQWQFTTSSSAPLVAQFEVLPRGRTPSYTGSVEVFGPQLEQGVFPTSCIPTSGTAVTRAVDTFRVPTSSGWYNVAEGTALVDADHATSISPTFGYALALYNTGNVNCQRAGIAEDTLGRYAYLVYSDGTCSSGSAKFGTIISSSIMKMGIGLKGGDHFASAAGATHHSGTVDMPVINMMAIGSSNGANTFWNRPVRRVTYFPFRIYPDAAINDMTR